MTEWNRGDLDQATLNSTPPLLPEGRADDYIHPSYCLKGFDRWGKRIEGEDASPKAGVSPDPYTRLHATRFLHEALEDRAAIYQADLYEAKAENEDTSGYYIGALLRERAKAKRLSNRLDLKAMTDAFFLALGLTLGVLLSVLAGRLNH